MRVAILGGPGSGKGTQAKMLSERYRVPQISTGDLLRDAVKNDKNLGKEVKKTMSEGKLVEDEVVIKLLEERLRRKDTKRGYIIDGFPRSIPQAQALDTLLGMLGKTLQIAINIDVDDDALVKRIVGRQICEKCGEIYNKYYSPPKSRYKCDRCGGKLVSREDDTVKTVEVRIGVYHQETAPLITYYRAQHKLRTMSGMGDMEEIHQKLIDLVDLEIRPLEIKTLEIASDSDDEEDSTIIAGGQINRVAPEAKPRKAAKKKIITSGQSGTRAVVKKKATKKKTGKKKTITRTVATKQPTAKKKASKQPQVKKKVVSKKAPAKKTPVRKKKSDAKVSAVVSKKKVTKKPASKKKAAKKKAVAKKPAARKPANKKPASKKPAKKKASSKKATKKKSRR